MNYIWPQKPAKAISLREHFFAGKYIHDHRHKCIRISPRLSLNSKEKVQFSVKLKSAEVCS